MRTSGCSLIGRGAGGVEDPSDFDELPSGLTSMSSTERASGWKTVPSRALRQARSAPDDNWSRSAARSVAYTGQSIGQPSASAPSAAIRNPLQKFRRVGRALTRFLYVGRRRDAVGGVQPSDLLQL